MSNDQKIMDKFVEQAQEILVLKDLNRKLMIENDRCKEIAERDGKDYSDIVQKLKIAAEALKFYADRSNWKVWDFNSEVSDIIRLSDISDKNHETGEYFPTSSGGNRARQAIKEIEGSIEKE